METHKETSETMRAAIGIVIYEILYDSREIVHETETKMESPKFKVGQGGIGHELPECLYYK